MGGTRQMWGAFILAAWLVTATGLVAQDRTKPPPEPDKKGIDAWAKAGAKYGWTMHLYGSLSRTFSLRRPDNDTTSLPAFRFDDLRKVDLKALPPVGVPFALLAYHGGDARAAEATRLANLQGANLGHGLGQEGVSALLKAK